LHHVDGTASPAGPINTGLDASTAQFTALLDSDDTYGTGAIDAWLDVQRRDRADVVIAPLTFADGRSTRTPPTRPFRSHKLDGVRDRLVYRTRQHGLVSRELFPELRMTSGLRSGEDVIQGARIWFSQARISYARRAPGYVIDEEDPGRTSIAPKPAAESLGFLDDLLDEAWVSTLRESQRESLGVKLLRTHVMDVLAQALSRAEVSRDDLEALRMGVRRIFGFAPGASASLSRRDAALVENLASDDANPQLLASELAIRTDFRRPSNLLPASPANWFRRDAPLRFLAAIALTP
jgi:hypothetical protein